MNVKLAASFTINPRCLLVCILQLSLCLHTAYHGDASVNSATVNERLQLQQESAHAGTTSQAESPNNLQVYWSKELDSEQSRASLFSYKDGQDFSAKLRSEVVVKLETGCGRPKNLLATLSDGTKVCCRYRENQLRELRGDFYSYHFNGYMGLWNAPPTAIISVNFSSKQWTQVAARAKKEGWRDGSVVAMSLFVKDVMDVYIPPLLRDIMHKNATITNNDLSSGEMRLGSGARTDRLREMVQWSDMALFDYFIGHTDRVFNTLFNYQWNKNMMEKTVHNLLKTRNGGQLLLIDNESGFWMGYAMGTQDPLRYTLQEQLLSKFCVFRKSTIEKIKSLTSGGSSPADKLEEYIKNADLQSFRLIHPLDLKQNAELNTRVSVSLELIEECVK